MHACYQHEERMHKCSTPSALNKCAFNLLSSTLLCAQPVLPVRLQHPAQPFQHVCELHPLPSGHHGGHPEAVHCVVVQGLWPILAAA